MKQRSGITGMGKTLLPFPRPTRPERLPKTVAETRPFLLRMMPHYARIEQTCERPHATHGRGHIIRAWMLAAAMSNICTQHGLAHDVCAVLCAVAGHDCGRQGSGYDEWEADSAALTVATMREIFGEDCMGPAYEQAVCDCVEKRGGLDTLEALLEQGADSLDIARCTKFRIDRFFFLRDDDLGIPDAPAIREELVREAKYLLHLTYPLYDIMQKVHAEVYEPLSDDEEDRAYARLKHEYTIPDSHLMQRYIQAVQEHKRLLPLLANVDFNGA